MTNKNTCKNQQALEPSNGQKKTKKDEGKPNILGWFSKAVNVASLIERLISFFEKFFGEG